MIRYIVMFTFLLIVSVDSYIVLNPGSYSTLVLFPASLILLVAILAVAPVWKVYFSPHNEINPRKRRSRAGVLWTPEGKAEKHGLKLCKEWIDKRLDLPGTQR
jgi:hypothetical protein